MITRLCINYFFPISRSWGYFRFSAFYFFVAFISGGISIHAFPTDTETHHSPLHEYISIMQSSVYLLYSFAREKESRKQKDKNYRPLSKVNYQILSKIFWYLASNSEKDNTNIFSAGIYQTSYFYTYLALLSYSVTYASAFALSLQKVKFPCRVQIPSVYIRFHTITLVKTRIRIYTPGSS